MTARLSDNELEARFGSIDGHANPFDVQCVRAHIAALTAERDQAQQLAERLADDAIVALAGSKIATPEEGYLKAPQCLGDDIKRLRKERDAAQAQLAAIKAPDIEALAKRLFDEAWGWEQLEEKTRETWRREARKITPTQAVARAIAGQGGERPRIVCLCGSTRFYDEFQRANYRETMAGRIVLSVGFYPHSSQLAHGENVGCTDQQKEFLDELHKRKIDLCDEVLVLDVGGYIGSSTRSEIEHAEKLGKPIRYLSKDGIAGHGEQKAGETAETKVRTKNCADVIRKKLTPEQIEAGKREIEAEQTEFAAAVEIVEKYSYVVISDSQHELLTEKVRDLEAKLAAAERERTDAVSRLDFALDGRGKWRQRAEAAERKAKAWKQRYFGLNNVWARGATSMARSRDEAIADRDRLVAELTTANATIERLKQRLLTAAGDDLCRLSQEEIKDLTGGNVPIPPKDEFLASCERFHAQIAGESGVNQNCLTLAQLIAENERLQGELATEKRNHQATAALLGIVSKEGIELRRQAEEVRRACDPFVAYYGAVLADSEWGKAPNADMFSRVTGKPITFGDMRAFLAALSTNPAPEPAAGSFVYPKCGGEDHYELESDPPVVVCGMGSSGGRSDGCGWRGTWSQVQSANNPADGEAK